MIRQFHFSTSRKLNIQYSAVCYVFYEAELAEHFETTITTVCKNLKRIQLPEHSGEKLPEQGELNMGTALFEVYLVLKPFAQLGGTLCPEHNEFQITKFHDWFTNGVTHWLDISVYKALKRIEKAIDLDTLKPIDETVKYSSSAVDTLAIFYQIKIFWQQLDWPDIEGSYTFIAKIVDDICRCCLFYADQMSTRVESLGNVESVYESRFEVTDEWCLAINNIDYIRQSLSPFVKELKLDEVIAKLAEYRSPLEAERCAETLKNVIANADDTETNKILELIEVVAQKMCPSMRKFLLEGAELFNQDSNSMDRLMMYLEESLKTLNEELNELNFERILDAIWTELAKILYELVQSNLDVSIAYGTEIAVTFELSIVHIILQKRRPPQFFSNLRETLRIMVKSFQCSTAIEDTTRKETMETIEKLLQLHGYETSDLIHQYYIERYHYQTQMTDTPFGQLTIKCAFIDDNLEVSVFQQSSAVVQLLGQFVLIINLDSLSPD